MGAIGEKLPQLEAKSNQSDGRKITRALRPRTWFDYGLYDISSDDEPVPKRGHKFCSRWKPKEACRPIINDAPTFYPSEEDFKDTLNYLAKIHPIAEKYGVCRIVPPLSWKPQCSLTEEHRWNQNKFATRIQQLSKLQNRESMSKKFKNQDQRKRKRKSLFGMDHRRNNSYREKVSETRENFGFQSGPKFTLKEFEKYADDFKENFFGFNDVDDGTIKENGNEMRWKPSVEDVEGEYWRLVEKSKEEVEVYYGADLDTGDFGSGFPKAKCPNGDDMDKYVISGWNLNNFPRLPGSMLSYEKCDISGILIPWLYVGMCFSSFCWHVEDHHLYSLSYMHFGDPKVWYGIPGNAACKLESSMRKHLPHLFEEQPDLLHELVTQFSPSILKSEGVPIYRAVQHEGEFVLTCPRSYHSGFNCGFNCAEAVNIAPIDWLEHGQVAVELYSKQQRKTSVSHDKMLFGAAQEAVRALWELFLLKKNSTEIIRWQSVCGKDGSFTKAIQARVLTEKERRESLPTISFTKKMNRAFDLTHYRECCYCFYDLHLSAVGCEACTDRFSCLNHANKLCSCPPHKKYFLFRYQMEGLQTLVSALQLDLGAIVRWASKELGLTQNSNPTLGGTKDPVQNSSGSF